MSAGVEDWDFRSTDTGANLMGAHSTVVRKDLGLEITRVRFSIVYTYPLFFPLFLHPLSRNAVCKRVPISFQLPPDMSLQAAGDNTLKGISNRVVKEVKVI